MSVSEQAECFAGARKGTGPLTLTTFISYYLEMGLRQGMDGAARNSCPGIRQEKQLFHLRTWKPKSCLFFFFFFLDRWDAKEGEDTSFLKDDPDSQVSSSVQGGLSSLLKTCTIRKVVSQYREGRSLCYGVNVSLDSTLQVAGRESIDALSV